MRELTHRQRQILQFLSRWQHKYGYPPTRAEIAGHFGFNSPNAAESHLKALESKGVLRILRGQSRGIELAKENTLPSGNNGNSSTSLPLIGQVAAGSPLLAIENHERQVTCDASQFSRRADYLLRVRGDSMINAGILNGDLLAVHQSRNAENGQIVVARLNDEVTVKRFFRRSPALVELRAENPDYPTLKVNLEQTDLEIEGLGVGVIRQRLSNG